MFCSHASPHGSGDWAQAVEALASVLRLLDPREAGQETASAVPSTPPSITRLSMLRMEHGKALFHAGRPADGAAAFEAALRADPTNPLLQYEYARGEELLGGHGATLDRVEARMAGAMSLAISRWRREEERLRASRLRALTLEPIDGHGTRTSMVFRNCSAGAVAVESWSQFELLPAVSANGTSRVEGVEGIVQVPVTDEELRDPALLKDHTPTAVARRYVLKAKDILEGLASAPFSSHSYDRQGHGQDGQSLESEPGVVVAWLSDVRLSGNDGLVTDNECRVYVPWLGPVIPWHRNLPPAKFRSEVAETTSTSVDDVRIIPKAMLLVATHGVSLSSALTSTPGPLMHTTGPTHMHTIYAHYWAP